jgi:hypothetical protein
MTDTDTPPLQKPLGKLIDKVERIREDLLAIQMDLEKMENVKASVSRKRGKRTL